MAWKFYIAKKRLDMKTVIKIVLVILFFVGASSTVKAQTFENRNNENSSLSSIGNEASQQNFLSTQNANAKVGEGSLLSENAVFITQIGDDNEVNSVTSSSESNIRYVQIGNSNIADVNVGSERIDETIFQIGDNNTVFDYNVFKNEGHNIDVRQSGSNQNLTLFGSNSISEKLKVSMQGQNQTIIVRNFN